MTTIDFTRSTDAAARPAMIATRVAVAAVNFLRAWKNRRAFYRMGEMSDTQLADIGLTRTDLMVAIDISGGGDPTAQLGHMAARRIRHMEDLARRTS